MSETQAMLLVIAVVLFAGALNLWLYIRLNRKYVKLIDHHRQFIHLIETPNDFMYYAEVYPDVKFKYLSPSAENFFGKGSNEDAYVNPEVVFRDVHPDDKDLLLKKIAGEVDFNQPLIQRWKDKSGEYRWFEEYATPVYEHGRLVAIQGMLRNIDERVIMQEKLEYQLHHDSLTDLYNRTYFKEIFELLDEEKSVSAGLLLCDLDQLKYTNDTFGHAAGDELIKKAADQLASCVEEPAIAARIGGDEFVVLLQDIHEADLTAQLARVRAGCKEAGIFLSIGAAYTASSNGQMKDLFSLADKNMYKDKELNKQYT
ncbi:sensor domain-containing diguanylate cyclase [Jeotgalibacillus terrae]|uniref:Diguanylate cyclase domain-containing protein n=1 Tax=Jeotgalibacillus terrae TaxID=587735 RepID=A0ABW5ZG36_9BACL|nr:sensor domain-containing diguanylate cyclase [Jeotgalibacillus terrae]MBM7579428.1 diguanylate cyclase (GGDEF)-like protein/PAS domain S-box-containing protein [Jeotgalibacillus terrae]